MVADRLCYWKTLLAGGHMSNSTDGEQNYAESFLHGHRRENLKTKFGLLLIKRSTNII
jgi:hypothetical protein